MKLLLAIALVWSLVAIGSAQTPTAAPASAAPQKVPGTRVTLTPPPGFTPSGLFPGFGQEEKSASIVVVEVPGPYAEVTGGFTKEGLAPKGLTLLSRANTTLNGQTALLANLRQEALGTVYLKWLLAVGDEKATVLITATFPEAARAELSTAMQKAVLSAQIDNAPVDPLAGLNFSIQDGPELKIARRMVNMLLLTKDGTLPGKPVNDPVFVVGSSVATVPIADLNKFAAARLQEIEQVAGIELKQQASITIAQLYGNETVAEGAWKAQPAERVVIYQVVLPGKGNYFLMQGVAPLAEREKYLTSFRRIARSFQPK